MNNDKYINFNLLKCLHLLEIPIVDFENYSIEDLKRKYRYLARKYHPDLQEGNIYSIKMSEINNAMDTIKKMIANGEIKLKETGSIKDDYSKEDKKNNIIVLYYRLDKLVSLVNSLKNIGLGVNQKDILIKAFEILEEVLEKLKIISKTKSIYDYGIALNYVELIELFYQKTLNINFENAFDFHHSNYIKESNEQTEILKDKLCLVHKQLLYNEVKRALRCFNENKKLHEEIINNIELIDREIINIKWYLCLNNFDFETFDKRVKQLIKKYER